MVCCVSDLGSARFQFGHGIAAITESIMIDSGSQIQRGKKYFEDELLINVSIARKC